MSFRFIILLLLIQLKSLLLLAQAVEINTSVYRNMQEDAYLRLDYGNDYFTATDYYLTQTVLLEFVHPFLKHNPVNKILLQQKNAIKKFGIGFEQNGYTPTDYVPANILYGDRPFAGTLSLKFFAVSMDTSSKIRLTASVNLGAIGPAAGAGDIQTYIHERTPNAIPQGWLNQIANDVVLNYQLTYEKQLLAWRNFLNISGSATAKIGTVNTKANVGLSVIAGIFNSPFTATKRKRFQIYAYDHPEINAVGYDATLQGGLFNKNSPYTITSNDVTRFVFRNNWGIVAKLGHVYLEYYQSFMTKEFESGLEMKNGGIQIGVGF